MTRKTTPYARKRQHRASFDPLLPFRVLSTAAAQQSQERLNTEQLCNLALGYHGALASFRAGKATGADANTLTAAANMCLVMIEAGLGDDEALAKSAQQAVISAMERHARTGRWGFTGQEMQTVGEMLAYHDAQLASEDCTEGLVTAVIAEVQKRVSQGHTLRVAA